MIVENPQGGGLGIVPEAAIDSFRRIAAAVRKGPDHRLSLRMLASPWRAVAA